MNVQLPISAHETEAPRGPRPARNRELLHLLQHMREPHDLRRGLALLRSEIWRRTCTHTSVDDLPFVQLRDSAALVHAETQRRNLCERELWIEFVPVQVFDGGCLARS